MKTFSRRQSHPEQGLLEFFLENPTGNFYESEAGKKSGVSLGSANKHLKGLSGKNILLHEKKGKMNFYRLNRENPLVKQLKKTRSLSLPLIATLRGVGEKLGIKVYLYGSVARGEDVEDSDWDILILGNVKPLEMERSLSEARKQSRKRIRLSLFTRLEWARMREKDPAFYERVEKDKIELA